MGCIYARQREHGERRHNRRGASSRGRPLGPAALDASPPRWAAPSARPGSKRAARGAGGRQVSDEGAFPDFVKDLLAVEDKRRDSLEARGSSMITVSASLVTLL